MLVTLPAIAATALGFVERRVGTAQHAVDRLIVRCDLADADAARTAHLARGKRETQLSARGGDAARDVLRSRKGRFRREQRKLLPAYTANDVRLPALGP